MIDEVERFSEIYKQRMYTIVWATLICGVIPILSHADQSADCSSTPRKRVLIGFNFKISLV